MKLPFQEISIGAYGSTSLVPNVPTAPSGSEGQTRDLLRKTKISGAVVKKTKKKPKSCNLCLKYYILQGRSKDEAMMASLARGCTGGSKKIRCIQLCPCCLYFVENMHQDWDLDNKLQYALECNGTKKDPKHCRRICHSCVTDLKLNDVTEFKAQMISALDNPPCSGSNNECECSHAHAAI